MLFLMVEAKAKGKAKASVGAAHPPLHAALLRGDLTHFHSQESVAEDSQLKSTCLNPAL